MKIVTNKGVYLQVKDLAYLSKLTGFNYFKKALTVSGGNINDFVLVSNKKAIDIINGVSEIIGFNEYYKMDLNTLSEYILSYSKSSLYGKSFSNEYCLNGLRDVLSFKKGELHYKIPLISTDVLYESEDTTVYGTTISDMYLVKGSLKEIDDILVSVIGDGALVDYDISYQSDDAIVRIKSIKKKKTSILNKLMNRKGGI
mgnify:CR=1 FL=1